MMTRHRAIRCVLGALVCAAGGCSGKSDGDRQAMIQGHRDPMMALSAFLGTWTTETETVILGEEPQTLRTASLTEFSMVLDGRYMLERFESNGDAGREATIGLWTWDHNAGKYRCWWFSNSSARAEGWGWFEPGGEVFAFKYSGKSKDGSRIYAEGNVTFVNDQTMTWTVTEYETSWKVSPTAEITSVSRK